jgi:DNA-directed RNA polymerase subunit alpha
MRIRDKSVDELELSVRTYTCLRNANIRTLGELVVRTEAEMLSARNFGRKSLNELKEVLAGLGLSLGMTEEDEGGATPVRQPNKPLQPTSGASVRLKD